jgi:hypothetical protein
MYEKAKAAYQDLIETISKYKEAKEAISKLTEGTKEWKNQVREINELVLELL